MKITRLQLLLLVLVLIGIGVGGASWYFKNPHPALPPLPWLAKKPTQPSTPKAPAAALPAAPAVNPEVHRKKVAQFIADVGETYRRLSAGGEIPAVAQPLHAAKEALAAGKLDEAQSLAEKALAACKEQKKASAAQTYHVARGDTLWTIAAAHSPVRAGAGWVAIWKANKRLVRNFDRIEVGWELSIPGRVEQYATPFWKPRLRQGAPVATASTTQLVDLRELPIPEREALPGGPVDWTEVVRALSSERFEAAALPSPPLGLLPVQYR